MQHYPAYEILGHSAAMWPENDAIYDSEGALNFKNLFVETENLRVLLKRLGVLEGMVVGLKAKNGRDFITGLFAIVGCGATAMPIYHQLKKAEIDTMVVQAGLHAILDDRAGGTYYQNSDNSTDINAGRFQLNFIFPTYAIPFAPHVKAPAFMRFTSGTTGTSKGVIISHQSVIERIDAANRGLELGPADVVVWVLPMAYHFIVSVVLYIKFGAAIAIVEDFLAANIIKITNKFKGTLLYASPLQIRLLAHEPGLEKMPSLAKIISTSSAISTNVCLAFKKRFGHHVIQAYGIIEIGLPMINETFYNGHADTVGRPLPDYTVTILDDNHEPIADGLVGHLAIKGPGMFDAYLQPARAREDVLINGYFLTADLASRTTIGLIKIAGRLKSVINISGIKIFPEEIEAFLETIPEIKTARITSTPHQLLGEIIEAEVILEEGKTIDIEDVLTYCRKRLSTFKSPQRLTIVKELPTTSTGKIKRDY